MDRRSILPCSSAPGDTVPVPVDTVFPGFRWNPSAEGMFERGDSRQVPVRMDTLTCMPGADSPLPVPRARPLVAERVVLYRRAGALWESRPQPVLQLSAVPLVL